MKGNWAKSEEGRAHISRVMKKYWAKRRKMLNTPATVEMTVQKKPVGRPKKSETQPAKNAEYLCQVLRKENEYLWDQVRKLFRERVCRELKDGGNKENPLSL